MARQLIAVTGASGFVGRAVCADLAAHGFAVRRLSRQGGPSDLLGVDYNDPRALHAALDGCEAVIHTAARAHVLRESSNDPEQAFTAANVELSLAVADAAALAGLPRFVFVSSIGAVCSSSPMGSVVSEDSPCGPTTPYGRSKLAAERVLASRLQSSATSLVVVRPPLVHGANAPGNLQRLRHWIEAGRPLPLGSIVNRRSLVHVSNLARALRLSATTPAAAGRTYHVRDRRDRSTPELIEELARSCGRRARLFRCPPVMLAALSRLANKVDAVTQITASLQVDDSRIRRELGCLPDDRDIEA